MHRLKLGIASGFLAASLLFGGAHGASAQTVQDGLVNVGIGDITIQDVNVNVAAQLIAALCVGNVDVAAAVLAVAAVDQGGDAFHCRTPGPRNDLTISNN